MIFYMENIEVIKQHLKKIYEEESKKYENPPELLFFNKEEYLEYINFFKKIRKKYNLICDNSILDKLATFLKKGDFVHSNRFDKKSGWNDGKTIQVNFHQGENMFEIIKTIYHEFKHTEQRNKIKGKHILKSYVMDFDTFRNLIEYDVHSNVPFSYKLLYDDFYSENEAEFYGTKMAYKYCSENNIYDCSKLYKVSRWTENAKMSAYDFDKFLSLYNNLVRKDSFEKLSKESTYGIFFDRNGKCRKLSQITSNPLFYGLDDRLKTEILTSRTFLSSVNYKLNDIEKSYISELVSGKIRDLTSAVLDFQLSYNNYTIDENQFFKYQFDLMSRIEYLTNYNISLIGIKYDKKEIMNKFLSKLMSTETRIQYENFDNLSFYINKIKEKDRFEIESILEYLNYEIINNTKTDNYGNLMSLIPLFNETMKEMMARKYNALDAEYEQMSVEKVGAKIR